MRHRLPVLAVLAAAVMATTAVLLLAGGGASAAPQRDAYSSCLKHANSTFEMDQCVGTELKRLKPLLDSAYAKLLNDPSTNAQHRRQLMASQKSWRSYVKRDCAFAGGFYQGGTLEPVIDGECRVDRERVRIKDLKLFAKSIPR
jgi:uncharacterized protein YecT (DUF1311 family)